MSIQLNKPSPRQLVGNLIPLDNPITKSASASNSEKKLKFIVGLSSNKPSTFKTSAREEENKSADLITESDDIPSPSRYQKAVRLTKPRNRTFHSMEYASLKKTNDPADVDDSEDYRKHLTTPLKTERLVSEDEDPQHILGKNAVSSFYMHYKKLDKIRDINTFTQVSDATYTSFLGKSETLNLLPSKIGFIKEKGEADKIKLNHFRLGDKYAEVLSEGLKSVRGLNKIELANNRLTPAGASHLLPKLTYQTELIDLAGNSIGKIGCDHLCSIIAMKNSRLLELNLEGNKLGDYAVGQLCEAIAYNNSLRKLNIGKNFLSDNSAEKISKMLELNSTLEELYLQWNQIKSVGGMTIVNGLTSSKLKILDFSWNSLGLNGSHFAKSFSTYISSNTTLAHLDLSNNYINKQDAKIISEELKSNHTLYGFHFSGNSGYVDCKGFLVIPDDWDSLIASRVTQPPIDGAKFQPESLKHHIGNWGEYKDVCWICEGWRPVEIEWISGDSGTQDTDPIYIHISYEGYKTVFLPSKNNFKTVRMAPPNKFDYFFSIDGLQTHDEGKPCGKPENPAIKVKIEGEEKEAKLAFVNTVDKSQPGQVLDRDFDVVYELRDLEIKPRIPDEVYIPAEQVLERPPWKFPISIFRNFKSDTQAFLDECFKVDFEGTRISKLVKNPDDLEQIKKILYDVYRPLRDCYKYYATIGAPSEIWSIPLNTYTEFCNSCGIIDGKILKLSDFDRIFIATYTRTEKDKNPRNPDRALVRYQFLEGLMRISEQKYMNTGTVSTYADAMRMLMSESVIPFINKFNHNQWRVERYWNEEVDTVYKSYLPVVRGIYKKYSGQKTLPGQKKFMCLEEFNRLVSEANMLTDNCGERDATLAFNLSMMNQIDELNSDRIYQMQFVEFLEALARITEKFSPPPYGFEAQNIQNGTPEATIPYEQRSNQLLHVKLEGLMPMLFSLCGNDVKEIWTLPETSIFQMTEVHGKQRFPTKKKKIFRINPTHHSSIEPYDGMNALQI